jgi:hypothetical protein
MLRRVALVRTDVSEELSPSIIRVTTIGELGTTLALTIDALCEEVPSIPKNTNTLGISSQRASVASYI